MRGFVKILEAVIASLLILGSLSFLYSFRLREQEWGRAAMETLARDAIFVLEKSRAISDALLGNESKINNLLANLLPPSVMWRVEIRGLPKDRIRIGCACTKSEAEKLKQILHIYTSEDWVIKFCKRNITFGMVLITLDESVEELIEGTDLIFTFNQTRLEENQEKIKRLLESDKGVVLVADLNETSDFISSLFNLSWKSGEPSEDNSFTSLEVETPSFHFARLFTLMPIRIDTNQNQVGHFYIRGEVHNLTTGYNASAGYEFVKIDADPREYKEGEIANVTDRENKTWHVLIREIDADLTDGRTFADISLIDENYTFYLPNPSGKNKIAANEQTILATSNGFSSLQLNEHPFSLKGRAIWMKSYDPNFSDVNQLLKSTLLFAAGEQFTLAGEKKPTQPYVAASWINSQAEFCLPYTASIYVWYVY